MADSKTVTVASTHTGETVVINNKKDGIKKYSLFFGGLILAAILEGVQQLWPNVSPWIAVAIGALQKLGIMGGAMALTSPFDQRGVVIHPSGAITGEKIGVPNPPSAPGVGIGMSILPMLLFGVFFFAGVFGLTGCDVAARAYSPATTPAAIPQSCPAVMRSYSPVPIATATRVTNTVKAATVGLKNPGAEPGETFSNAQGGASCEKRLTADGWITVCPQPNDGDSFDSRNQARQNAIVQFPNLLGAP